MKTNHEYKITDVESHLNELCEFMEKLGVHDSKIVWAMIWVAMKRYNIELIKSK